uniref:PDZ domain-containing protein n=1 Tax=Mesocestoides corti TaxID=53468 RepID=A0A5K3F2Z6_MESCO
MTSMSFNSSGCPAKGGPMRAYYIPPSASLTRAMRKNPDDNIDGSRLPKTYWTDSEDALSIISSYSNDSSPSPVPRLTRTSTLKRTNRSLDGSLQQHFPTVAGAKRKSAKTEDVEVDNYDIVCACCTPQTSVKRPLVAMGAGGIRAIRGLPAVTASPTTISHQLAPVCPVPMPPQFASYTCLGQSSRPVLRSTETQTSPPSSEKKVSRRSRSRRSSGALLNSIKKKINHIRRSVSSDRAKARLFFGDESNPATPKRRLIETSVATKYTLIKRSTDGSRLIQMKRRSISDQFGIFIKTDSEGLYVSRLGNQDHVKGERAFLRTGDRVLEVQNVPARGLDTGTVRSLLQGCHVATIRVKSTSR